MPAWLCTNGMVQPYRSTLGQLCWCMVYDKERTAGRPQFTQSSGQIASPHAEHKEDPHAYSESVPIIVDVRRPHFFVLGLRVDSLFCTPFAGTARRETALQCSKRSRFLHKAGSRKLSAPGKRSRRFIHTMPRRGLSSVWCRRRRGQLPRSCGSIPTSAEALPGDPRFAT